MFLKSNPKKMHWTKASMTFSPDLPPWRLQRHQARLTCSKHMLVYHAHVQATCFRLRGISKLTCVLQEQAGPDGATCQSGPNEQRRLLEDTSIAYMEMAGRACDASKLSQERDELLQERRILQKENVELQDERDDLSQERDDLLQEQEDLQEERDELQQERDDLSQERDGLSQERQDLSQERDNLSQERDDLQQENHDLIEERDQLAQERQELLQERDSLLRGIHIQAGQLKSHAASAARQSDSHTQGQAAAVTAQQEQASKASQPHQQQNHSPPLAGSQLDSCSPGSRSSAAEDCQDCISEGQSGVDAPVQPDSVPQGESRYTPADESMPALESWTAITSIVREYAAAYWPDHVFLQPGKDLVPCFHEVMHGHIRHLQDQQIALRRRVAEAQAEFTALADEEFTCASCQNAECAMKLVVERHTTAVNLQWELQRRKVHRRLLEEAGHRYKDAAASIVNSTESRIKCIDAAQEAQLDVEVSALVKELLSSKTLDLGSDEACRSLMGYVERSRSLQQRVEPAARAVQLAYFGMEHEVLRTEPPDEASARAWLADSKSAARLICSHKEATAKKCVAEHTLALYKGAAQYIRLSCMGVLGAAPALFTTPDGHSSIAAFSQPDGQPAGDSHQAAREESASAAASPHPCVGAEGHAGEQGKDQATAYGEPASPEATGSTRKLEGSDEDEPGRMTPDAPQALHPLDSVSCPTALAVVAYCQAHFK